MNTQDTFEKKRYIAIRDFVSKDLANLAAAYSLANELHNPSLKCSQVPDTHSIYGDFLMESMLVTLQPKVEAITGLKLLPTYTYYRLYRQGAILQEHTDRASCEISCSLCLGYDYVGKDYAWPIRMDGTDVTMTPGDAVIYRGIELPHSRAALDIDEQGWHAQVFLHWVEDGGQHADQIFDNRSGLYMQYGQ